MNNEIGSIIRQVQKPLLDKAKAHWKNNNMRPTIFADYYDLVIYLWNEKLIQDSRLSMDILHFFNHYSRFVHIDPTSYSQYLTTKQNAEQEKNDILNKLQ